MPRKIDRLVLWDPAFDGASHLEELTGRRDPQPRNVEVSGYPLSTELQAELAGAKLPDLRPGPLPVLIAWSNAPNENASFELGGCPITTEARDAAPCWVEEKDFGAGAVPIEIIQAIASWLQQK